MSTTTRDPYARSSDIARRALINDALTKARAALDDPDVAPEQAVIIAFEAMVKPGVVAAAVALGPGNVVAAGPRLRYPVPRRWVFR